MKLMLGWSRDSKGKVRDRHPVRVSNAITTFCGGGRSGEDGMGNTTPYILDVYVAE